LFEGDGLGGLTGEGGVRGVWFGPEVRLRGFGAVIDRIEPCFRSEVRRARVRSGGVRFGELRGAN